MVSHKLNSYDARIERSRLTGGVGFLSRSFSRFFARMPPVKFSRRGEFRGRPKAKMRRAAKSWRASECGGA